MVDRQAAQEPSSNLSSMIMVVSGRERSVGRAWRDGENQCHQTVCGWSVVQLIVDRHGHPAVWQMSLWSDIRRQAPSGSRRLLVRIERSTGSRDCSATTVVALIGAAARLSSCPAGHSW